MATNSPWQAEMNSIVLRLHLLASIPDPPPVVTVLILPFLHKVTLQTPRMPAEGELMWAQEGPLKDHRDGQHTTRLSRELVSLRD